MPDLLHHQERDRLLRSLRLLLLQGRVDGQAVPGVAHDSAPDALLPTRDNAMVAELMAIPALRAADPVLADAALSFTALMATDAGPLPRGVPARPVAGVEILRADPRDLRVVTPWHEFTGDLTHGVLRQRLRGERRENDVLHTGNMVRLRPGSPLLGRLPLRPVTIDVEDHVGESGVQPDGAGVVMWHESALQAPIAPGLRRAACSIRYEYRVSAADPVLRLTVTLRATGTALAGLRLTTAVDALSEGATGFVHASTGRAEGQRARPPGPFTGDELLSEGPAASFHLWQDAADSALALHIRPRAPEDVFSIRLRGRDGAPHWLVLRHSLPPLPRGGTATLREDRLLVRGVAPGAPGGALRLLRDPEGLGGRDPGQTGAGLSLAAMATALLHHAPAQGGAGAPPLPRELLARLRDALDRHLAALPEDGPPLPVAELAPLVLALDAALRGAGGEPGRDWSRDAARDRRRLVRFLRQLAEAAGPAGGIGRNLAEHGAALLALARAAGLVREPWVAEALRRGLMAVSADPVALAGAAPEPIPSTVALSALLRAVRAAEWMAGAGGAALDAAALAHAASLRDALLGVLSGRLRAQEDRLEVLPGGAGEPDAASTAALLLAVLSPDELAVAAGGVPA